RSANSARANPPTQSSWSKGATTTHTCAHTRTHARTHTHTLQSCIPTTHYPNHPHSCVRLRIAARLFEAIVNMRTFPAFITSFLYDQDIFWQYSDVCWL